MKIFLKLLLASTLLFILAAGTIVTPGLIDNIHKSDVIVVLGNRVEPDGTPSPRLKSRLDKAAEIYEQVNPSFILVSGGIGKEGFDEAKVMKEYLVEKGIPAEKIWEDNKGVDSFETAKNTKAFMEENNLHSALLVTNYYHVPRTYLALKKAGIDEIYSAHANYFEMRDLYSIPREVIGYAYYLVRP